MLNAKNRSQGSILKPGPHSAFDVRTLKESPENVHLYRERTTGNPDFARLVQSVKEKQGIEACNPIVASRDAYVISGHLRRQAAILTGFFMAPIFVLDLWRHDHTPDEWLAILRQYNTGRVKTFDEMVREQLVDINPEDAVNAIVASQIKRTSARIETIDIGNATMKRAQISAEKRGMASAILSILQILEDYLPVSLRAIHYRLLNQLVWRNSKTQLRYINDLNSYKDLSDLATRMRLSGEIPWDAICDETRPVTMWACWNNGAEFMGEKFENFLKGYARNLLQSQEMHLEIVAEKLTVQNFIEPIAMKYRMPVVIMRGNSGIDARYQIAQRFKKSGKSKLFLPCLGDCDPDGDSIVETTLRSMRDDFHCRNVDGCRVAMTHEQADELSLPKMLDAKEASTNYRKFVERHGRKDCYELEAVEPDVLQGWLDQAIRGVIDVEAFNHEVAQQAAEATEILAQRKTVLDVMKGPPD